MSSYYGKEYFEWQKRHGRSSAIVDTWKFENFTSGEDKVLDFGCGGGYMLASLKAKERFGLEPNDYARAEAEKNGIKTFPDISAIPSDLLFDVIISHHALEHIPDPFRAISGLHSHLRQGGKIIFVLPFDDWRRTGKYEPEANKHLFTWSPLNIGNLFERAGFKDIRAEVLKRIGIPKGRILIHYLPRPIYILLCRLRSLLQGMVEVRIVASR